MNEKEIIAAAYDSGVEEEYNRLVSTPWFEAEYKLITERMEQYIQEGSVVVDVGAGPGRYAEFLLKRNCRVGLVDLSKKSLDAFESRIDSTLKNNVLFSKVSCATDLSFIRDEFSDAVFLMGPLYHLTGCGERTRAIAEAFRILKKGGVLFAVFLSTYENHHHEEGSPCCSESVKNLLKESITTVFFQNYPVPQYRCLPDLAMNSLEPCGFETLHIRNLENRGPNEREIFLLSDQAVRCKEELLNRLRMNCENPYLAGLAGQYLYIGRKS